MTPEIRGHSHDEPVLLVVGDEAAKGLATRLADSATVRFASGDESIIERARSQGLESAHVRPTEAASLCGVTTDVDVALVVTDADRTTLFTAQLLKTCCDVPSVVACLRDASNRDVFRNTRITVVDTPDVVAAAVSDVLPVTETGRG
jgi:Trk K+ transport system NAD-binding subunit